MARGLLANQAGRHQTLRGNGGLFQATDSHPSLDSASPSPCGRGCLGQPDPPCSGAYFLGLAGQIGLVRLYISLLLFVAVVLKSDGLSIEFASGRPIVPWTWLVVALIPWELLLSIWLVSGMAQRRALLAALGMFGAFSVYSLGLLGAGASSCRCFGRWELHPAWTLSLDLTTIWALLWLLRCPNSGLTGGTMKSPCSHSGPQVGTYRLRGLLCLIVWLSLSALFLAVIFGRKGLALDQPGMTDLGNGVLLIEPEKWDGHPLPILKSVDIQEDLKHGEWEVLLMRGSCPHCQTIVNEIQEGKSLSSHGKRVQRWAIIDFDEELQLPAEDLAMAKLGALHVGQVDAHLRKALVPVPVIFDMTSGVVHNVQFR
jgi:hypothetical protein